MYIEFEKLNLVVAILVNILREVQTFFDSLDLLGLLLRDHIVAGLLEKLDWLLAEFFVLVWAKFVDLSFGEKVPEENEEVGQGGKG
jgi:hypothetical protein